MVFFIVNFQHISHLFLSASIVDCENVNISWVDHVSIDSKHSFLGFINNLNQITNVKTQSLIQAKGKESRRTCLEVFLINKLSTLRRACHSIE